MTPREKQALDAVKQFWNDRGYSPAYQDIADMIGLANKSSAFRLIASLRTQGLIETRRKYAFRDIRPVNKICPYCGK